MKAILILIGVIYFGSVFAQDNCAMMPVEKGTIGSLYGYRIHPNTGTKKFHAGIDIRAKEGTLVYAAFDGVILSVNRNHKDYGNYIQILHDDGLITFYAHLSAMEVKTGAIVCKGNIIGKVGSTGNATGPHLHFEIREDEQKLNPLEYL